MSGFRLPARVRKETLTVDIIAKYIHRFSSYHQAYSWKLMHPFDPSFYNVFAFPKRYPFLFLNHRAILGLNAR